MADAKGAPKRIRSELAILDVKDGRHTLFRHVGYTPRGTDYQNRVPVTITGFIVGAWGGDDGTSREFQVDVTAVKIDGAADPDATANAVRTTDEESV